METLTVRIPVINEDGTRHAPQDPGGHQSLIGAPARQGRITFSNNTSFQSAPMTVLDYQIYENRSSLIDSVQTSTPGPLYEGCPPLTGGKVALEWHASAQTWLVQPPSRNGRERDRTHACCVTAGRLSIMGDFSLEQLSLDHPQRRRSSADLLKLIPLKRCTSLGWRRRDCDRSETLCRHRLPMINLCMIHTTRLLLEF